MSSLDSRSRTAPSVARERAAAFRDEFASRLRCARVSSVNSHLRLVLHQLGPKPGSKQNLQMLVTEAEIPGEGWTVIDQRTWRTGVTTPSAAWVARARAVGSITGWRSFQSRNRYLWVQMVPTDSAEDAVEVLHALPGRGLRNRRAQVRVEAEREVTPPAIEGADHTWAQEQDTAGHPLAGVTRMLAWTIGNRIFCMAASGQPDWAWDELAVIATRQNSRIRG